MLIKTKITKILSNIRKEYKYWNIDSNFKFGKEKTDVQWNVTFQTDNGKTYYYNFRDGRKVNTFYEGKELWGMEGNGNPIKRFEYWWWSKKEFERRVNHSIEREKELIERANKEIPRLQALLS